MLRRIPLRGTELPHGVISGKCIDSKRPLPLVAILGDVLKYVRRKNAENRLYPQRVFVNFLVKAEHGDGFQQSAL
jgi:hypothetical protein